MNHLFSNRKKATITIALIAIIAVSSGIYLQNNSTTQAALISPHPGIVGSWSFDEGVGTTAGDNSGKGNTGTIHGATWVPGMYGNALSFDGSSNYVGIPSFSSLTGPTVSVDAWINLPSQTTQYPDIVEITQNWGGTGGIKLQVWNNDQLWLRVYNAAAGKEADTPKWTIATNSWHHIVGTYDGSYAKLYVDGALFGTSPLTTNAFNVGSPHLNIGVGFNSYFIKGTIDEVRIYNRALSSSEVQAEFQTGPGFTSSLTAKIPKGTTQMITTLSWQGSGSINATIISPSQSYTEDIIPVYQKTSYSTSNGDTSMLNIKRLSVSVNALPADQNWNVTLTFDNPVPYQVTVEVQK